MARTRKTNEEKHYENRRNVLLSNFWADRITAGEAEKEEYHDTSMEVMKFFKAKHDHLYSETSNFMNFTGSATVSVPKVAQLKNSIGPRIYVAAPTRTVTPRTQDGVMVGMCRVLGAYLTYTAKEARFAKTIRNTVDDGLISGRMVLRQVWDDVRKIITSVYVDSLDLVFDPDFTSIDDASWIAIRHREPWWQLERRLPKWRTKGLKKHALSGGVIGRNKEHDSPEKDDDEDMTAGKSTATVVEWWEILSKMGNGFRGSGFEREDTKRFPDKEDFVRLAVVLGHDCLLEEGPWDVPLHLDRTWPVSAVDFVETPRAQWPESPMGQVLPLQKAVDLLTSLRLSSCKNRDRVMVFIDKKFAKAVQEPVQHGTSADIIPVDIPAGYSLDMVMKIADFGQGSPESDNERQFLLREMDTTLGTTSMATGGQDEGSKDRSAFATQTRNAGSEVRTADLENKVQELLTDAACKEALAVRLFVSEEDVASIVRPEQINLFYISVMLPGQTEMPVRPLTIEEDDEDPNKPMTLLDLYPGAATYFNTPDETAQVIATLWEGLMDPMLTDPRRAQIRDALLSQGLDEFGIPLAIRPQLVSAERVWQDTAGLTAEELMRELSYEIEAGKGVKFNKEAERANVDNLLQTVMPAAMTLGDIGMVNNLLKMRYDAYQTPPDKQVFFSQPDPAMEEEEGEDGEEEGEGEEEKGPPKEGE